MTFLIPADAKDYSPMFQQYFALRGLHDAVLAYEMGDFLEFYFDDAAVVSKALDIALTKRGTTPDGDPIPLCGVPTHCVDQYLLALLQNGISVSVALEVGPGSGGMKQWAVCGVYHPPSNLLATRSELDLSVSNLRFRESLEDVADGIDHSLGLATALYNLIIGNEWLTAQGDSGRAILAVSMALEDSLRGVTRQHKAVRVAAGDL